MTSPLVSVLVTAYNAEPWIADTLASVRAQSYANLELVVVDDGSTDRTLEIASSFEHPRCTVIAQENQGACAARNRALSEASGDFIQYLDADDLLAPEKIEIQVQRLLQEPNGTVASGPWVRFYDASPPPDRPAPNRDWHDYTPASDWLLDSWAQNGMFASFAWLTPRSVIEAAGPWNERIKRNQDGEFFARVLLNAHSIAFCGGAWGFYRSGIAGSVSARRGASLATSLFDTTELCVQHLGALGDTPDVRAAQAACWEQFMFEAYPLSRSLAREAEARANALGGGGRQPDGGRLFRLLRDTIGWKAAVRFQSVWYRVRYNQG
ncbi:MAG: glycosyltransferase family A protein [Bacteroidota bacterium]